MYVTDKGNLYTENDSQFCKYTHTHRLEEKNTKILSGFFFV